MVGGDTEADLLESHASRIEALLAGMKSFETHGGGVRFVTEDEDALTDLRRMMYSLRAIAGWIEKDDDDLDAMPEAAPPAPRR